MNIFRPAFAILILMTLLTGFAYPFAVTGVAQAVFPDQANGSLIVRNSAAVGSSLIGQPFTSDKYFHGRPSATTPPYNAAASGAANRGPTSKALVDRVKAAAETVQAQTGRVVPVDLVTTSASGLDPHISPAATLIQAGRVAHARNIPEQEVLALIEQHKETRLFGFLGEPRVNVLELNLALDEMAAPKAP